MLKTVVLFSATALFAGSAFAQCGAVTTLTTGGNGQSGTMFEIVNLDPATPMVINTFDQCFFSVSTVDMEIYTLSGSCAGLELTSSAWTLVGSTTGLATNAYPVLDPVPIPVNIVIPPSGTQSFYVTTTNGTVAYTTGTNQYGAVIGSDANIQVIARTGMSYPFGSGFGLPTAGRLWNGTVNYCPGGTGTVFATATSVGAGCVTSFASAYENFATAAAFDLANSSMSLINTGTGYTALTGITSYVPPSAAAVALALGDDTETAVTLSGSLPYPGGSTTSLTVCSNGYVSVASGNGTGWTPNVNTFLNAPQTGWWTWHDNSPNLAGSGQVKFEEVAGVAYITWDGVWDYGSTSTAGANTWQLQFELATGNVHFHWQTMSGLGNPYLVGYSPGGASLDPGNRDISATLPGTFVLGAADILPLHLASAPRPIGGNSVNLTTSNIGQTAVFGAILLGINNPMFDLTPIGMAGCTQYTDAMVTQLFFTQGNPSVVTPFSVPNLPGLHVFAQSVVFDPAAGLTSLGAVASQGIDHLVGDY